MSQVRYPDPRRGRWRGVAATGALVAALLTAVAGLAELPGEGASGLRLRYDWQVWRVEPGSPADQAGFRKGDVLADRADARTRARPGDVRTVAVRRDGELLRLTFRYAALPSSQILREVSVTLVSLAFFLVAHAVFVRRSDAMGLLFFLFSFDIGLLMMRRPQGWLESRPLAANLLFDLAVLALPPLLVHFFLLFPEGRSGRWTRMPFCALLYLPSAAAFAAAIPLSRAMLASAEPPGRAVDLFESVTVIYFLLAFMASAALFIRGFRRVRRPWLRRRLRGVLVGTTLALLPLGVVGTLVGLNPSLEIPGEQFAPLALVLLPLSFGHAVVRYGIMDVEFLVKRSVVYALVSAVLVAGYLALVDGLGNALLPGAPRGLRRLLDVSAFLLMAAVFNPLRARVQGWVDRTFYREQYNYRATLREHGRALTRTLDRERIVQLLTGRVDESLHPERTVLLLRERGEGAFLAAGARGAAEGSVMPRFGREDVFPRRLAAQGDPERLEGRARGGLLAALPTRERRMLLRARASVAVPLMAEDDLIGILLLGPKRSGERVSAEDLDLLETLADQAATALQNARRHEEELARARVERELATARDIQRTLLPPSRPVLPGLDFVAASRSSAEIGGDLYDYFTLAPGRIGVVVADAMGNGIPAALLAAALQQIVRGEADGRQSPAEVLARVNRRMCERIGETRFASCFYGEMDLDRRVMVYSNAGHEPPFLRPPGLPVRELRQGGLVLGVDRTARYEQEELPLEDGALLVLYTDGLIEASRHGEMQRDVAWLRAEVAGASADRCEALVQRLLRHAGAESPAVPPEDDVTVVVIRLQPPSSRN